jgi:hypothetical protein
MNMVHKKKEEYYYKQLAKKVKSRFKCFEVKSKLGTEDVGQVDIAGVRDIGGYSSGQIELIIFEVKKAHEKKEAIAHFGRHIGQTLSYSIISNRCYLIGLFLPHEKGFSDEQKILANHFGVGLIEAELDNSGKEVRKFSEVLTSNYFVPPVQHKMDKVLSHLGIRQCCTCRIYFRRAQLQRFNISPKALDRDYLFSTHRHKEMFICHTCAKKFSFKQKRGEKQA